MGAVELDQLVDELITEAEAGWVNDCSRPLAAPLPFTPPS